MAQNSAETFELELAKFADSIDVDAVDLVKTVALDLLQEVIRRTPVDTGVARASWSVGVVSKPAPYEAPQGVGIEETLNKGISIVGAMIAPQNVWIVNTVPYILYLENGRSQQAPQGMAGLSVLAITAKLEAIS